jgi:hypothetical protein
MAATRTRKREVRAEIRRIADLVQDQIDRGATSVEEIHLQIAALPLEVLERLDVLEKTAKDVRKIQVTSIGAVYDAIRKVNREVNRLAVGLLDRSARAKTRAKPAVRRAAKPARKVAGRKAVAPAAHAHAPA